MTYVRRSTHDVFALAGAAIKIFWLIVFGVDEEKFRAVEARGME